MRGATESIARVRYRIGFKGKCEGGGAPGRRGFAGLMVGIGDVRRCWRMRAMFCCQLAYIMIIVYGVMERTD